MGSEIKSLSSLIGDEGREAFAGSREEAIPTKKELYELRLKEFEDVLSRPVVDVAALRRLAMGGIPDGKGFRAIAWMVFLGYLPEERSKWKEALESKRKQYADFCEEFIVNPSKQNDNQKISGKTQNREGESFGGDGRNREGSLSTSQVDDDPLSTKSDSVWNKYFKDNEVKDQIARDVDRTHPDIHFFNNQDGSSAFHKECMRRTLFVYAKLNPGLMYVQGMNELHAPLLWTFKTDAASEVDSKHAEADSFFCFMEIMSEFRDHFCKQLDNSSSGIRATMTRLLEVLQEHDYELWDHLHNRVKIDPQYFAFRWLTLMLTQEYTLPDAVQLWDCMLADPSGKRDSLLRTCIGMILLVRSQLLAGDFASNLKLLQNYPPTDVSIVIQKSQELLSTNVSF